MRNLFREYVNSRLETYRKLPDIAASEAELQRSLEYQDQIWKKAVVNCGEGEWIEKAGTR